jgi:UDP-N-acetylmuramate--alanine ligase
MQKPVLKSPIHFIGIGGSGMAPLAELCHAAGLRTQGSDPTSNKSTRRLDKLGVHVFPNQDATHLPDSGTVVYSSAIPRSNPEFAAASQLSSRLLLMHRSELLAEFVNSHCSITIAGTHGKTTTSAMVAYMLNELGLKPSAAIGGRMLNYDSPALVGDSDLFVAEADESDGSLVRYRPFVSVLTNIGEDHLDNLKNLDGIKSLFSSYLEHTSAEGCAVLGWDNPHCRELGSKLIHDKLSFGFVIGADVRAYECTTDRGGAAFKAVVERDQVKCKLKLIGKHNVQNALAALAVARVLELDVQKAADCLSEFAGVARRTSLVFDSPVLSIFDDYAHNPEKISACVRSLAHAYSDRELIVVFQPHRFSRLQTMFDGLVSAFQEASMVIVLPTYAAGEASVDEFSTRRIAEAIGIASAVAAIPAENFDSAVAAIAKTVKKPAIILTVGAGDVWQCGPLIRERLHGKIS